jgi:para-nitrobenzyl esterase
LPFVFGTLDSTPPNWPKVPATAQETALSDAMLDYWTSFARSGKPKAAKQPDWPAYGSDAAYMEFNNSSHPAKHLLPGMYALHEETVCRRKAAGGIAWNWNTGLASPVLPPKSSCAS